MVTCAILLGASIFVQGTLLLTPIILLNLDGTLWIVCYCSYCTDETDAYGGEDLTWSHGPRREVGVSNKFCPSSKARLGQRDGLDACQFPFQFSNQYYWFKYDSLKQTGWATFSWHTRPAKFSIFSSNRHVFAKDRQTEGARWGWLLSCLLQGPY